MRSLVVVALVACGPGLAQSKKPEVSLAPDKLEDLVRLSITNGGLWFDDATCAAKFGQAGDVASADLPAFRKCLGALDLRPSKRGDAIDDVRVYSYAPGFEIEARIVNEFDGPRLAWIGFASRGDASEPPTVTAEVLESLRTAGDKNGPLDPGIAAQLVLDPTPRSHSEYAWLKVCLSETGGISSVVAYEGTSGTANTLFTHAVAQNWKFRPFTIVGQPVPVCAMVRPEYPAGGGPALETLPFPPPRSENGKRPIVLTPGVRLLEGKRIRGNKSIAPDADTKAVISSRGRARVVGAFRFCVSEAGDVYAVMPMKSTGYASYDRDLVAAIQQWKYRPYMVDGTPVPVCTNVVFIYDQR